ncbi:hypothetical protein [Mycobacterium sp. M23085]|uniref:hypothetical protein n=1 Tax=Mycobacterium sp. M23085 TaxID=3378087 RepID=UPI0038781CD8
MSVQDDKGTDQEDKGTDQEDEQRLTEKPEPDEDDKKEAAKMMEAYEDKPTIVLPGTGGSVSGTAVNDWLDEDGNPRHETPEGSDASDTESKSDDDERHQQALQDQIEKDKALNETLREAAKAENKGEKD